MRSLISKGWQESPILDTGLATTHTNIRYFTHPFINTTNYITRLSDGRILAGCFSSVPGSNAIVMAYDCSDDGYSVSLKTDCVFKGGGTVEGPGGITQLNDGRVAIADSASHKIHIFSYDTASGGLTHVSTFSHPIIPNFAPFTNPYGITQLPDGRVFVAGIPPVILDYDAATGVLTPKKACIDAGMGTGDGQFNMSQRGCRVLADGRLAVCSDNRVQTFDYDPVTAQIAFVSKITLPTYGFYDIIQLGDGRIMTCDVVSVDGVLGIYDYLTDTGTMLELTSLYLNSANMYAKFSGMAVLSDNTIIAADRNQRRLVTFDIGCIMKND